MTPTRTADTTMIAPDAVQAMAAEAERDAVSFVALNKVDVIDLASLDRAVKIRAALAEKQDGIISKLKEPKQWANRLHKWFCSLEATACKPLLDLDAYERRQIQDFKAAQDRARQERERLESEQLQRENEARAAQTAAAYEQAGEHQVAAAVLEEAIATAAPIVVLPDETKQIEGLSFTRRWLWRYSGGPKEVKDTPPEVIARTMELIPRSYLCVDEKKVGAMVRSSKGTLKIPGLDIFYVDDPRRG